MGIKNFLFKFIKPVDVKTSANEYFNIAKDLFEDPDEEAFVHGLMIEYVCNNGFQINPAALITVFKEYDYTMDEFFVVLFKLGTLSQLFVDKPDIMLEHAITRMPGVFDEATTDLIQINLTAYKLHKKQSIIDKYTILKEEEEEEAENKIVASEDTLANNLIDNWIKEKETKQEEDTDVDT